MSAAPPTAADTASACVNALYALLLKHATDNLALRQVVHRPALFDDDWLGAAQLSPQGPHGDWLVTLAGTAGLQRSPDERDLADAYRAHARTRVYENIHTRTSGWAALVALHLARLTRRQIPCTLYHSVHGDDSLGAHVDHWDGIILQLHGAKRWTITDTTATNRDIVTEAGDVLLLPADVQHEVTTPRESAHLVFALTRYPLPARPGDPLPPP
ncbi:cupin domain-containing protein [Streptomyces sp. DSM 44917]|uniref:Cupin domain-containing protein n=1 Tax=Streptomyces boetiae TaxID=3075541 RepID=A0ABU2L6T5_9ACTN|nr:cupin domain-containing protein [Streptomyces sp. DSM 44917]MDT0307280.1 cupin domain-containing protein [Streptomyces sp. DSM 44917]